MPEVIEKDELDQRESVKSELKEIEFVSVLEDPIKNDVIKSENVTQIGKRPNDQHPKVRFHFFYFSLFNARN